MDRTALHASFSILPACKDDIGGFLAACQTPVAQLRCADAANAKYATGYPHSQDHWGAVYGFVGFLIALFGTWPAANNAAIFAEVRCLPPVQGLAMLTVSHAPATCK